MTHNIGLENVCVCRNFLVGQGEPSVRGSEIECLPLTAERHESRVQSSEVKLYGREYVYTWFLLEPLFLNPPMVPLAPPG
jgi:hypothetical protein